jgi:2-keto-3-deoxy-L-fuconate dehydrogenase
VLDDAAVAEAVGAAGPLDVLFNCAGFVHQNTALTCTDEEWEFAFALNVRAMWRTARAALPAMLERRRGSIVNMASACSSVKGAPNRFLYGTTKAAVVGLTKAVATEHVGQGVRCNCLCPGTVETPSLGDRIAANAAASGGLDAARGAFVARQAMGRLATPEEIAALACISRSTRAPSSRGRPSSSTAAGRFRRTREQAHEAAALRSAGRRETGAARRLGHDPRPFGHRSPTSPGEALSAAGLARLAALDTASLPRCRNPRLGPPVAGMRNLVCIGLNYADHAAETGRPSRRSRSCSCKSLGALNGPNDDVVIPKGSRKADWEVELAIIIGARATCVPRTRRWTTWPATPSATTCPSASGRSSAAAPGTKARAATPSAPSALGW